MSETSGEERPDKRPLVAAGFSLLVPGLGHVYLRRPGRGLLWLLLLVATAGTFVPGLRRADSLADLLSVAETVPPGIWLLLGGTLVLCVADAYVTTLRQNRRSRADDGHAVATCPNCGRDLDADLEFCHWCTETLDDSE